VTCRIATILRPAQPGGHRGAHPSAGELTLYAAVARPSSPAQMVHTAYPRTPRASAPCSAKSRRTGEQCRSYAITGGHLPGGAARTRSGAALAVPSAPTRWRIPPHLNARGGNLLVSTGTASGTGRPIGGIASPSSCRTRGNVDTPGVQPYPGSCRVEVRSVQCSEVSEVQHLPDPRRRRVASVPTRSREAR
jgi:hypothetical protein